MCQPLTRLQPECQKSQVGSRLSLFKSPCHVPPRPTPYLAPRFRVLSIPSHNPHKPPGRPKTQPNFIPDAYKFFGVDTKASNAKMNRAPRDFKDIHRNVLVPSTTGFSAGSTVKRPLTPAHIQNLMQRHQEHHEWKQKVMEQDMINQAQDQQARFFEEQQELQRERIRRLRMENGTYGVQPVQPFEPVEPVEPEQPGQPSPYRPEMSWVGSFQEQERIRRQRMENSVYGVQSPVQTPVQPSPYRPEMPWVDPFQALRK
ncbi:hypothetical protein EDC01DRAFT_336261 [Geopyxis carbonaria]|nr:hypothetical protein EDC01DRAFT_336261 [Geopyxis carbonaria]